MRFVGTCSKDSKVVLSGFFDLFVLKLSRVYDIFSTKYFFNKCGKVLDMEGGGGGKMKSNNRRKKIWQKKIYHLKAFL